MGERAKCRWCQKLVYDKPLLGTLNICVSPIERQAIDANIRMGLWQVEMQKRVIAEPNRYLGGLQNVG
jgi:acetyl-CoA carboxylase beta subunit